MTQGGTFTCDVTPGAHHLRANNRLVWKTVEFLAPAGIRVHFTCINYAPKGMLYMLALFGVAPLLVALKPGRPRPHFPLAGAEAPVLPDRNPGAT